MPSVWKLLKAKHRIIGNVEPINTSPRTKERNPSSHSLSTQTTSRGPARGASEPGSSGSDRDEESRSALAETVPQLPPLTRISEADLSVPNATPSAGTATTPVSAPDLTSLDGAAGSEHAQPGMLILDADDDDIEDIDDLIASLEATDQDERPLPVVTEQEIQSPSSPVPEDWLGTDINLGLTTEEADARRRHCGFNELHEEKKHILKEWLSHCHGPVNYSMALIAILAACLQHWTDFGITGGLMLINIVVGSWQERRTNSVVSVINKSMETTSRAFRDGGFMDLERRLIVPGDILKVEEGTVIPADGRIVLEGSYLQVDQSAMTGESLATTKKYGDTCFGSSLVRRGKTLLIVTDIGDNTRIGRMAAMVARGKKEPGYFRLVLEKMVHVILVIVFMTLFVVWTLGFYRSKGMIRLLDYTIVVALSGVPVGMPTVVTTTLSVGSAELAKKQALVKNLNAIEALAGVQILCTDKTGTLTKNQLTMEIPYTVNDVSPDKLMLVACLAASRSKKGMEPIDRAFLKALKDYPSARQTIGQCKIIEFTPFDPVSKKVTAVCDIPAVGGGLVRTTCVKGAPLTILKMVTNYHRIAMRVQQDYEDKLEELAGRGFRSIGVAARTGDDPWELLGIVPCTDPPRHDTAVTIKEAKALGLRIKMLTGDSVAIAREMSRQLDIGPNIYDAGKLALAASTRSEFIEAADGFAEVFPEHKHLVVNTLQQKGYLVAMTGDGVNDAPSLKKADAGIAVKPASDAAQAAADIVLHAPGLSAIIDAVKISRRIFHRINAYIVYRIALTVHLQLFLGVWLAILDTTMSPGLITLMAIIGDLATISIAYDNALEAPLPCKWQLPQLWGTSIILGGVLAAGTWICYGSLMMKESPYFGIIQGYGQQDAVLYLEIVLTQHWLIFITRTRGAFWSDRPSWKLLTMILFMDTFASVCALLGWFQPGRTSAITVVRVWIFSFGVFGAMATVYWALQENPRFEAYVTGRRRRSGRKERLIGEFLESMQRMVTVYAQWNREAGLEQARRYGRACAECESARSQEIRSGSGRQEIQLASVPQADGSADGDGDRDGDRESSARSQEIRRGHSHPGMQLAVSPQADGSAGGDGEGRSMGS